MRRSPLPVLLASVACLLVGSVACGPSFQALYEGNARFEHCYALEERPQRPMQEKSDCWKDWSERYTYGQTRDRIHYAIARYVALAEVPNVPTDEALMMAAPGMAPRASTVTAPSPTNAFAPPPKVLPQASARAAAPNEPPTAAAPAPLPRAPTVPPPPRSDCTERCASAYRDCGGRCQSVDAGSAGAKGSACAACEKPYRTCMRLCFK